MKFYTGTEPFVLDGTTKITITFEVGDIFIDADNKVKGIRRFLPGEVEFFDDQNASSFELWPLTKDFFEKYRFAGTVEDDKLPVYEDAISLAGATLL